MLHCSPPSALRMLDEFVDLSEGDVVVQNGANSAVGQVPIYQITSACTIVICCTISDNVWEW